MEQDLIRTLLGRFVEVDGVTAVALSTDDGLLIEGVGPAGDLEAVTAVGTYLLGSARRLQELDGWPRPTRLTADSSHSCVLLQALGAGASLAVLMRQRHNAPYVGFLVDRYSPELQSALQLQLPDQED